jgi:hypothetical protein
MVFGIHPTDSPEAALGLGGCARRVGARAIVRKQPARRGMLLDGNHPLVPCSRAEAILAYRVGEFGE